MSKVVIAENSIITRVSDNESYSEVKMVEGNLHITAKNIKIEGGD